MTPILNYPAFEADIRRYASISAKYREQDRLIAEESRYFAGLEREREEETNNETE